MNKKSVIAFVTDTRFLFWFLVILTTLVSFAQSQQGFSHMWTPAIFKLSFYNLTHNQNMYALHNQFEGQWVDIYKYSPAFALLYAPIAALPLSIGMIVWNLLNVIVFFFAIRSLPFDNVKKAIIIAIGLLELILSVQNSQSNILMCGLIILGFTNMEKKNVLLATLCIVLSIYIKLFGVVALMIFLFYPEKLKFIGYTILWSIILFFLPLLVVSVTELSKIYHDWAAILKLDATEVWQLSIMGVAKAWFGLSSPQIYIQLVGAIFLAIPLISFKSYQNIQFRLLYLASILIWVVTFNHKAESPSYIIAATGIGIWFVTEKASSFTITLMLVAIAITSLAHSDLVPLTIRINYVDTYMIKAIPAFIVWLAVQYKIYVMAFSAKPLQA